MIKKMMEDKMMPLPHSLAQAIALTYNISVNKLGFSLLQIVPRKAVFLPVFIYWEYWILK